MNAYYPLSSSTRVVSAVLASVITATLFIAVAIGSTREDASVLLAQGHEVTVQSPVRRA